MRSVNQTIRIGARKSPLAVAQAEWVAERVRADARARGSELTVELVGIGVSLAAGDDSLIVNRVIAGGGAEAAGIVEGDHLIAVDGQSVLPLGIDGTIARIRGVEGSTLVVTLRRDDKPVQIVVQRRKLKA